jgi:tRNA(Ile2) C34 agmatinyltransferase TiaS
MRYFEVLQAAIEQYGEQAQMVVALEELAELQKEITKCLRGKGNPDHLAEEMADVQIVFDQLEIIAGNRGAVAAWQTKKVNRLAERIEEARREQGKS